MLTIIKFDNQLPHNNLVRIPTEYLSSEDEMRPPTLRVKVAPLVVLVLGQLATVVGHSVLRGAPIHSQQAPATQASNPNQPAAAPDQQKSAATDQQKPPDAAKKNKNLPKPAPEADSGQPKSEPLYILEIIPLMVPSSDTDLPPDANQIVTMLGNPSPFVLKSGPGDSIIIYYPHPDLDPKDRPLLGLIKRNICQLESFITHAIEISVANASALGDLLTAIKSLNYEDIKVEAIGTNKIRAICDERVSPARFRAFVQDVHELSARITPESPVAKIYFIKSSDATTAVSPPPPLAPAKSPEGPAKSSPGASCADAKTPPAPPPCCPANQPPPNKPGAAPAPTSQSPSCPSTTPQQADASSPDPKSTAGATAPDSSAKPGVTVASLSDLLVFSDEHPGDDAAITERKRILAAVDFPRPEVIINTFSFQASSTNPDTLYETANRVRHEMGNYNDGLQAGIVRAWTYLEEQISSYTFFDNDFVGYLTKLYIADFQPETPPAAALPATVQSEKADNDLSKINTSERLAKLQGDRSAAGVCDVGKYCLGYTSLFHPLKPSLTDLLLAVIASKKPGTQVQTAIFRMEGKDVSGAWPSPLIPCLDHHCQEVPFKTCEEKYCKMPTFQTCEEADEQELKTWNYAAQPRTFIFPMNCFRAAAELVFPTDPSTPSLVGPLRAALADFLYHYKMSQQYPHEFSPYQLSRSAQELNSELNPLVLAYNRDLAAALRPLKDVADPRNTKGNGWAGFSGHGSTFINNGILTVRTISGKETTVDAITQNFFDATNPPSITDVVNSIGAAESNTPAVLKANLSADEAAAIIGTLNSVKPSISKVGREFKIDITPRSLSGASAAELEINMTTQETADPTLYTNGKADSDNLSRMAKHTTETKVRLESAKLFEISAFTALLQRSRKNFPLVPPFVEIPYINSILSLPLPGAKEYHMSTAIMSAVVVPTAADLASGLVFTDDRVAMARDGAKEAVCAVTISDSKNCVIRRAISTSQFPAYSIGEYHKAMIRCFSGGGFFAATSRDANAGCGSLQFETLPPDGR
jgi:hypothetical protein